MSVLELGATGWKSPLRKLARFFERSRDKWKAKYRQVKRERRGMESQIRAVENSREIWADRAKQAEQRVRQLEQELAVFKKVPS